MKGLNIQGDHGHVSAMALYPDYKVSSIPLYEIIDKKGLFRYLSDTADRDILGQFQLWIAE